MISVAMCTYNGVRYVEAQLFSIMSQAHPVDEIVICDDRSDDGTVEVIEKLMGNWPGLIKLVVNKEQLHVSANFEKAIKLCSGDYIFLSDQDDVWHKDKVSTILQWFDEHPNKDVVFSNARIVGKDGTILTEKTLFDISGLDHKALKWFDSGLASEMFLFVCRAGGLTMAMRRRFVPKFHVNANAHKVSQGAIHDEMIALCAIGYDTLGHCDKALLDYRLHGNNTEGLSYNSVFKNPNPYRSFVIDLSRYGELPLNLLERARFINERASWKYGNGMMMILKNFSKYHHFFGVKSWRYILLDVWDWSCHAFFRFKSFLNRCVSKK
jgi:glycosyltransferase involved in cell wall biosynthesis